MFDRNQLNAVLASYKRDFAQKYWPNERYKWEAVKFFQDNWDIHAADFSAMLTLSLSKTYNLLVSMNNFPAGMIQGFAKKSPEEVRAMFIALFDESKDVVARISHFKDQSSELLKKYGDDAKQHYQYENAISTYLWLRYPDKYYIYKFGEVRAVAKELNSDYQFKKGAYSENLRTFYRFYDELCGEIRKDKELITLFKSLLVEGCYPDREFRTLTIDIGFYISRYFSHGIIDEKDKWFPSDYSPNISIDAWVDLLNDSSVFTSGSLQIMKRIKDYGGQATCTQLSIKYGEEKNFYNSGSSALARRVAEKTNCPVMVREDESARWWPILYVGRNASKEDSGSYIWKLRDELSAALDKIDLSQVELFVAPDSGKEGHGYWWLNANPKIWSFSNIATGEVQSYTLYNDNHNKRRIFQNFLDAKVGDIIIGYESNPVKQIVAICKVSSEQDGERIFFQKTEVLPSPIDYQTLRNCSELERMEYFNNPQGSLFKLTKGEYDFIIDIIREENPSAPGKDADKYTKDELLNSVFMSNSHYESLISVLKNKKNIILQGAPGVGKTFAAKRLAYAIMGEKDESRIEFVQFHQNYSYEDFVMGYKPVNDGFELKYGIFYRFCQKAANQPDKDYFFIIDEINRGNLSKIFGELLMLIERDYRGTKATLAYNGFTFSVPKNLYIIGMMNTADRSLAMIDYALRRRFSFFEMEPGFDSDGFIKYQNQLNNETLDTLIERVKELNKEIRFDKSLGNGFCIGHSYFCEQATCTNEWMYAIIQYDILPMLREYWFDDNAKLQRWQNMLLPLMQSDITLSNKDKILIIDAKYYSHTTQVQYDAPKLHSNNLYQIFTYVKNKSCEKKENPYKVSGMLLYARTDEAIQPDNVYQMSGSRISVQTLDLNNDFNEISRQLSAIAESHFEEIYPNQLSL